MYSKDVQINLGSTLFGGCSSAKVIVVTVIALFSFMTLGSRRGQGEAWYICTCVRVFHIS